MRPIDFACWATAAGFTVPLLVLSPFGIIRWRPIAAGGWPLVQAGFLMAACIAPYAELHEDLVELRGMRLVPGGRPWALPNPAVFLHSATWLLIFRLVWMPLVLWLAMFGGSRLEPGRVAVLLM